MRSRSKPPLPQTRPGGADEQTRQTIALPPLAHPKVNQHGQLLGTKGQLTRERLIHAVEELLRIKPLRELRQVDICRAAQVSAPTFYLYFTDVQALVLEAIAYKQMLPPDLQQLLEETWPAEGLFDKAREFVRLYVQFWDEHYHLFKARNLAADEGDPQMSELRLAFQVPILEQLAAKIAAGRGKSKGMPTPIAGATVVMSSLERLAPTLRFTLTQAPRHDMSVEDVLDAEAWVFTTLIKGS